MTKDDLKKRVVVEGAARKLAEELEKERMYVTWIHCIYWYLLARFCVCISCILWVDVPTELVVSVGLLQQTDIVLLYKR